MNIELTPELQKLIQDKVDSAVYRDQSEVVEEGLKLLVERDRGSEDYREALKRSVARGLEEAEAGLLRPGEEVLSKFRKDLESRL